MKLSDQLCPACRETYLAHLKRAATAGGSVKSDAKTVAVSLNAAKANAARWAGHVKTPKFRKTPLPSP